ncbi:cellulose synthase complex periplasmic endoglucanase BcsZ [Terriglobus sp.]|uniref:cellulose synthase complex periplasmic endoglucanase BcsZ n=1 Tax=Terriglobus sp. TaxID=1889013 RepID=UPI003AFF864B
MNGTMAVSGMRHRRTSDKGTARQRTVRRKWASASALLLPLLAGMISFQAGCRAEQQWPLWQHYRERFLDGSGRVVDHGAGDKTTSEGQAYGMFFALVVNDRKSFDQMLRWTEDNLAGGDLTSRLPAWSWGKSPDGEWKQLDSNSAADADLWLAYDCLEAGRLWNDDRLSKLGAVLADRMTHSDVALIPGVGTVLIPGPQGFHPSPDRWVLNPSYMPPQVVARIRQQTPEGPWASVQADLPMVLTQGASSGFAMDWLAGDGAGVHPSASPGSLAQGKPGAASYGSYDAIRVYLWLGTADRDTPGISESIAALTGMARYLSTATTPPLQVDSNGTVTDPNSPVGFSAAVYPYLLALGKRQEAKAQIDRVDASLDPASGLYGRGGEYYDQNLVMFAMGWRDGRFRFDRNGRLKLKWR